MKKILVPFFAFFLLFAIVYSTNVQGEEEYKVAKLTDNNGYKHNGQATAINKSGEVIVVWPEAHAANQNKLMYRIYSFKTKKWTSPKEFPAQDGNNVYVRLAGGEKHEFFAVWSKGVEPGQKIYFSRYYDGKWSKPVLISQPRKHNEFADICYDAKNKRAVAIWVNWPGGDNLETYIREFKNLKWGDMKNISNHPNPSGHPAITSDGKGNLYTVYMQMTSRKPDERWQIAYNTNRDGKWLKNSIILTDSKPWKFHPSIAVNEDGTQVMITWYDYGDKMYYYQYVEYNGKQSKWYPVRIIDEGHKVHAIYYNSVSYLIDRFYFSYVGSDNNVYVKEFYNNSWSDRIQLSDSGECIYSLAYASPYYGLSISWTDKTDNFRQIYVALLKRMKIFIMPPKSIKVEHHYDEQLFRIMKYNTIEWVKNEENIVDGESLVDYYYVFRVKSDENFDFNAEPYKKFSNDIISFADYFNVNDNPESYKYAIIAVDKDGNKSDPLIAQN